MKNLILAAVTVASMGLTTAAFAQGLPAGTQPQQYGSHAFDNTANSVDRNVIGGQ
jgi:hypothetical protein